MELKESLTDYLSKMETPILDIAKKYRNGGWQESNDQMQMLTEGLSWVVDAIHLTKEHHGLSAGDIQGLLAELTEALENQDALLTADLLEYELIPKIGEWKKGLLLGK